jgi:hypothetical protein
MPSVVKKAANKTAPAARGRPRNAPVQVGQIIARLEQRLVLLRWLLAQFGAASNADLLKSMAQADEGFDESGVFHVTRRLLSQVKDTRLRHDLLHRYDANVRRHLEQINHARSAAPLQLRYFQVLSLLFTELYLDRLANGPGQLLADLNAHLRALPEGGSYARFQRDDLRKLAFWMATGSGKTLLLHFNLLQYRHYFPGPLNNLLLITPNEGLSAQHIAEARASGLHAERFDPERPPMLGEPRDTLHVIEITKLVEDKRGGGVSVPVSRFTGSDKPNLIFVDEGHKGSGGETWKKYRDQLGATGFTFEYSATFGQALNAAGNEDLTEEYGKAIAFDYSYRYFHGDGFGKDFRLLNLDSEEEQSRHALMAANLLSYYQQLRVFDDRPGDWARYGIEKPLWVYVGAKVNGKGETGSDILTVLRFLEKFIANKRDESSKLLKALLHDERRFRDADGRSLLQEALAWLRGHHKENADFGKLFADVLKRVFHHRGAGGGLEVQPIRGADGEMALRVTGADEPFGVVNVGEASDLLNRIREVGLTVLEDVVGDSLFSGIQRADSPVNLLIGAKKFIEGWSSWRVSSLGLLNVGKSEGAQIIQLFGRGVRLLGLHRGLKRSSALPGLQHPKDIEILERLNVFSVRASYMQVFRDSLLREGMEDVGSMVIELPLWKLADKQAQELVYFQPPEESAFRAQEVVPLEYSASQRVVRLDLSSRMSGYASVGDSYVVAAQAPAAARVLSAAQLDLIDWQQVYFRVLEKKRLRQWHNVVVRLEVLRSIVEHGCEFIADDAFFNVDSQVLRRRLQEGASEALEAYFERQYRLRQNIFESRNLQTLRVKEAVAQYPAYWVTVRLDQQPVIKELLDLRAALVAGRKPDADALTSLSQIRFDGHLYQPLFIGSVPEGMQLTPGPLASSEREFVDALQEYWVREKSKSLAGRKVFLLRNQSRGKGLGFYETHGFFPDFILWVVGDDHQHVAFVEPHGLRNEALGSDKISGFHDRLKAYLAKGLSGGKISVDGWIVSGTPKSKLDEQWGHTWTGSDYGERHILFPEGGYDAVMRTILAENMGNGSNA